MAHTNATENYNLPQFLGTDKPAWLGDINPAFQAIDTQMKNNADGVTSANATATQASNKVGNLENLQTTEKSNTVGAINEINQTASTASSTAGTASDNANTALTLAQQIAQYIDVEGADGTRIVTTTSGTVVSSDIRSAKNSAGTLGKVYGQIRVDAPTANTFKVTISDTGLRPTADVTVKGLCTRYVYIDNGSFNYASQTDVVIKTNGTVEISTVGSSVVHHIEFNIPPCLLFIKDFGD